MKSLPCGICDKLNLCFWVMVTPLWLQHEQSLTPLRYKMICIDRFLQLACLFSSTVWYIWALPPSYTKSKGYNYSEKEELSCHEYRQLRPFDIIQGTKNWMDFFFEILSQICWYLHLCHFTSHLHAFLTDGIIKIVFQVIKEERRKERREEGREREWREENFHVINNFQVPTSGIRWAGNS